MTDQPNREAIARRIRALRAKTVENGCTEAEALAAAEMLATLLARYNMTVDEAELRASPFTRHREEHTGWVADRLWKVADGAAHLTGARYWQSPPGVDPVEINFFGFDHEVAIASYLAEICRYAMQREQDRILSGGRLRWQGTHRQRRAVVPFLDGMADRLRERIRALKPAAPVGQGLIILRNDLILKAMELENIRLKDQRARGSRDLEGSYFSGRAAGDRVPLNRGVADGSTARPGLIGRP